MTKSLLTLLILSLFTSNVYAQKWADAGPDKEICIFDTLEVTGSGLNPGDTGFYVWKKLSSNTTVSNSELLKLKITSQATEQFELSVTKNVNGTPTVSRDTFELNVNSLPTFTYKGIPPMCFNECPLKLTESYVAVGNSGFDPNVKDSNLHYYQRNSKGWISGNDTTPYQYNFCNFLSNDKVPQNGYRDTICYEYTDPKGCYNYECKPTRFNPNPTVEVKDGSFCQRAGVVLLDKLVVKPFIKTGGIQNFRCLEVPANSGLDKNTIISPVATFPITYIIDIGMEGDTTRTGNYIIEYSFKDGVTGCESRDTFTVTVIKLPDLTFRDIPKQCINGELLALDSFVIDSRTGKYPGNTIWSCVEFSGSRYPSGNPNTDNVILNCVKNGKNFDPKLYTGQFLLKCTSDASGCPVSDSVEVLVNGLPIVRIDVPDTVCSNSDAFNLTNIIPAGNVGIWSGPMVTNDSLFPSLSPKLKKFEGPFSIKYTYTNPITSCTSSDSQKILIKTAPNVILQVAVTKILGKFYVRPYLIGSLLDTTNDVFNWTFSNGKSSNHFYPGLMEFADSGDYTVSVSISDGLCSYSTQKNFRVDYKALGIDRLESKILVYPNPANDVLNLELKTDGEISITNVQGKTMMVHQMKAGQQKLDIKNLPTGIYTLTFKNDRGEYQSQVIIKE